MLPLKWFLRVVAPQFWRSGKQLYSFKSGCFGTIHFHHHTSTISFFYREEGNPAGHRRLPPQSAGKASLLVVKGKKHQSQPLKSDGAVKSYHSLLSTTNPLYYPQDSMPTARAPAPGAIAAPPALRWGASRPALSSHLPSPDGRPRTALAASSGQPPLIVPHSPS